MAGDLYGLVAGLLQGMTHAQLSEEPQRVAGWSPYEEGLSKRQRIEQALGEPDTGAIGAACAQIWRVIARDIPLDEAGRKILEANDPPRRDITRRDVARALGDANLAERSTRGSRRTLASSFPRRLKISSGSRGQSLQ